VTVEMVIANLQMNVDNAKRIIRDLAGKLPADRSASPCGCSSALKNAIITDPAAIPTSARERYALLLDKYLAQ
jgi:5'-methylthioadenosine phosphorylase